VQQLRLALYNASLTMAAANDLTFSMPIAPGVPAYNYTTNILGGVYVSRGWGSEGNGSV
jgi:hypothetical protein